MNPGPTRAAPPTVAVVALLLAMPNPAQAQTNRPQNPDSTCQAGDISRAGLQHMLTEGGGLDDNGNFQQPIQRERVYAIPLPDCRYVHHMEWEPANAVIVTIDGGLLRRIDFLLVDY